MNVLSQFNTGVGSLTLFRGRRTLPIVSNGSKSIKGGIIFSTYIQTTTTNPFLSFRRRSVEQRTIAVRRFLPLVNRCTSSHTRSYFGGARAISSFFVGGWLCVRLFVFCRMDALFVREFPTLRV